MAKKFTEAYMPSWNKQRTPEEMRELIALQRQQQRITFKSEARLLVNDYVYMTKRENSKAKEMLDKRLEEIRRSYGYAGRVEIKKYMTEYYKELKSWDEPFDYRTIEIYEKGKKVYP